MNTWGGRLREHLRGAYGDLIAEVEGIAEGAGQDSNELMAINARTELRASVPPECSTVALLPDGAAPGCLLAQNWDYHPRLRGSRVVWQVSHAGGSFVTFAEAGIVAKIGMNSAGLGVCLNGLRTSHDRIDVRVPIHFLLRQVLQSCSTLTEAEATLTTARVSASACITCCHFAGGQAEVASFELSPLGVSVVRPTGGVLVHTNHFLMPPAGADDVVIRRWPDTRHRYDELVRALATMPRPIDSVALSRLLSSHAGGERAVCSHASSMIDYLDRSETMASIIMDLSSAQMLVSDGSPCTADYRAFPV